MITNLELRNFRIFKKLSLTFNKNIIIFIGDNALGKTSILEAIHFLCLLKSPRTNNDNELIMFNEPYTKISMKENMEYMVALGQGKKAFINNSEVKLLKDYIGYNNVVMFSPNDLDLVYGSPLNRRHFLDLNISQISKEYINVLQNYKKLLKERNEILKQEKIDKVYLDVLTKNLILEAKKIIKFRYEFVKELNDNIISVGKEKINIVYKPSVSFNNIEEDFKNHLENDINAKSTNFGPHRDDLIFKLDEIDASYASQGQVRTISLALKLTLVRIIKKYKKKNPIVLLDDVLSELDDERKNNLMKLINNKFQVFITSTDVTNIDESLLENAQIIRLGKDGILNG